MHALFASLLQRQMTSAESLTLAANGYGGQRPPRSRSTSSLFKEDAARTAAAMVRHGDDDDHDRETGKEY